MDTLVKHFTLPDENRDEIYRYLQAVEKAGIAFKCLDTINHNELVNHALAYALEKRLPADIKEAIGKLRKKEDIPIIVLHNLFKDTDFSLEANRRIHILFTRGLGGMLAAQYNQFDGVSDDGYYVLATQRAKKRGLHYYHRDFGYNLEPSILCKFSTLTGMETVPDVPTVFVPFSKTDYHNKKTNEVADIGEAVHLEKGDMVLWNNERYFHARYDLHNDGQPRVLLGSFFFGEQKPEYPESDRENSENIIEKYPSAYHSDGFGKEFIEHVAEHTLVNAANITVGGQKRTFQQLLEEAEAAKSLAKHR